MTAVIDHTAFPEMVNNIIRFGDHGTRMAFRSTSSTYCAYVNKIHFKHMLIRLSPGLDDVLTHHPLDRDDLFGADYDIPRLLDSVEVLDVSVYDREDPPIDVLRRFPFTHTLRRLGLNSTTSAIYFVKGIHTVVDFVHTADTTPGAAFAIVLQRGPERHIIHYRWQDNTADPLIVYLHNTPRRDCLKEVVQQPDSLKEVVLALWPVETGETVSLQGLFGLVIDFARQIELRAPLKIVGLEKLDFEGRSDTLDMEGRIAAFFQGISPRLHVFYDPAEALQRIKASTIFLTFDEWWHELGEHKEIHGMCNPRADVEVRLLGYTAGHNADPGLGLQRL